MKLGQSVPQELVIMTTFHGDRTKIVDFLLIVTFLANADNLYSPSILVLTCNKRKEKKP